MRGVFACVFACAAVAAWARPAAAGDPVTAVLDAQARAIARPSDADGFAATLAPGAFVSMPAGYATAPAAAGLVMIGAWHGSDQDHQAASASIQTAVIGHAGGVAWATAELTIHWAAGTAGKPDAPVVYRITELLTREAGGWKAQAFMASQAMPDRPGDWANNIGEDPSIPGAHGTRGAPLASWLRHPASLATHLHPGNAVIVLGSAPGERAAGPAAARLLRAWKKLTFTVEEARQGGDGKTYAWLVARIARKVDVKGWPGTREPYWAMVLAVKGAHDWEVVSAHFTQEAPGTVTMPGGDPCGGE